ncbi:RNA polymerase sigma factor [Pedobacter africanus]|uniref:RNA polymerase sigma-70 factor, ECF subfamily n=1 Tax=Pedobacter africanus TaxID=151894 RepID=A0A1W1Z7R2_9SPHI|nr:RNA polymerase sigma-70 factor [Pedobacter africanus]SMC44342.1 RNA polymerase sigma-70 factor, ECF subfamily [Pedobacter africanus]
MAIDQHLDNEQLKSRLAAGDSLAFKILFDKYYKQLVYFANRFTGDMIEAEDIVMDVFAKFWQKKATVISITNLSSFLFGSVKNACIDLLRKEARFPMLFQELQDELLDQNAIIEGEEIFARLLQQVYEQIESLPDQCKSIFKLIYLEGKSTKEVAAMLNLSVQTVRNQKTRGLSLIRAKITPQNLLSFALLQIAMLYTQAMR